MNRNYWVGDKIRLRPIEEKDAEVEYYQINKDYDSEAERLGACIEFPLTPKKMRNIITEASNKDRSDDEFWFVIETLEGEVVGNLFTFSCNKRMGTFKYGIDIAIKHRNKGYGSQAVLMVLRYYFEELRYQKVNATVYSFNDVSIQFHEKFGFIKEGTIRRMIYTNGKYFDEIYYGMTKEEFDHLIKNL